MKREIAVIAGEGALPVEICRSLSAESAVCVIYSFRSDNSAISDMGFEIKQLDGPSFADVIGDMKGKGITSVIFAGKVPKKLIYRPELLDEIGRRMLAGLDVKDDHSLLGRIADTFEGFGVEVLPYRDIIPASFALAGHIAGREPSELELHDMEYGREILKTILPLSFGQAVVVADGAVVAVEAMEGTDETIKRAGGFCKGGVVVKMMKAGQDERFDLPTVGTETLDNMASSGLTCLAVESGRTIILNKEPFCSLASRYDISVIGL